MHVFFESLWKLHIGEIPEKPMPVEDWETKGGLQINVGGDFGYSKAIEKYNEAIAAIKQNALTVGNPHLTHVATNGSVKPGEFYFWPGGYETKEMQYRVRITDGKAGYIPVQTVAILTLPEEEKECYGKHDERTTIQSATSSSI